MRTRSGAALRWLVILCLALCVFPQAPTRAASPDSDVIVPPGSPIEIALAAWPGYPGAPDLPIAAQMAMSDYGPIKGYNVQRNEFDAGCDPTTGAAAATAIVSNTMHVGVIGPLCSSSTSAALPIFEAAALVMISPASTSPDLPPLGPTVFNRVILPDPHWEAWDVRVSQWHPVIQWSRNFAAAHGHQPDTAAKYVYDATMLLLYQIDAVSTTGAGGLTINREALAAAVRGTSGYNGLTGDVTLNAGGDRIDTLATWVDPFSASTLQPRWSWLREDATHWSLTERPGFLRITTENGTLLGSSDNGQNVLLATAPALLQFEIATHVYFTPTENFQIAGLLFYQDDGNFLWFGRAYCSSALPYCAGGNGIYFDHEEGGVGVGSNYAMTTTLQNEAYLRLRRDDQSIIGYYSENGNDWIEVGTHTIVSGMIPLQMGLTANNSVYGAADIPADFDYFLLNYAYRVTLPLAAYNIP